VRKRPKLAAVAAVGTPMLAATTLVGVPPAYAGTRTVGATQSFTFVNTSNQSVTCSFRLQAENTPYQNQPELGYAEFDNVSTDPRCIADLSRYTGSSGGFLAASWRTPTHGPGGGAIDYFGDVGPGQNVHDVFAPIGTDIWPNFVVDALFTFRNCAQNCINQMPRLYAKL
jgi:hypothetical protein